MLISKAELVFEIIKLQAQLYEIAVGAASGSTPMRAGVALEAWNDVCSLDFQEEFEGSEHPAALYAKQFLEWVYLDKERPEWLPDYDLKILTA